MRNDDIIQSIRYILDVGEGEIANILKLTDYKPKRKEIEYIFDDTIPEDRKVDTTHELTAYFLDGLIYYKRGKSDKHPPRPIKTPVTNNMVMKKLRVAFKLRDDDILEYSEIDRFFNFKIRSKCAVSKGETLQLHGGRRPGSSIFFEGIGESCSGGLIKSSGKPEISYKGWESNFRYCIVTFVCRSGAFVRLRSFAGRRYSARVAGLLQVRTSVRVKSVLYSLRNPAASAVK
ncbi:MAG: DUF1456 family protein [Balneolaceae bacterium]|nr:DUF1456 family protein [Balneolaceae bacterium]